MPKQPEIKKEEPKKEEPPKPAPAPKKEEEDSQFKIITSKLEVDDSMIKKPTLPVQESKAEDTKPQAVPEKKLQRKDESG